MKKDDKKIQIKFGYIQACVVMVFRKRLTEEKAIEMIRRFLKM